jgi:hypothetical protein
VQVNTAYKPTANAGEDVIVCWYVTSVPLLGVVTNYKQFGWSTTGSGSFSDPYALETNYLPTLNDKIAGFVNIKLVALSNSPCSGNVVDTVKITFDACTGIPVQNSQETGLSIRPNPAHGTVSITLNGTSTPPAVLTITSTDGKILFSETVEAANATFVKQLDISGYAKGIYVVQLKTGKKVITEKMIVQ